MKYLPHQILKFLSDNYSDNTIELNDFLADKLLIYNGDTFKAKKLKIFLNELEVKEYIVWEVQRRLPGFDFDTPDPEFKKYLGEKDNRGVEQSMLNNKVFSKLTATGIDYVLSMDRLRQQHNIYKWATPLAVIFACLAFVVSLLNYLRGC